MGIEPTTLSLGSLLRLLFRKAFSFACRTLVASLRRDDRSLKLLHGFLVAFDIGEQVAVTIERHGD
jgi:hypothetical protein